MYINGKFVESRSGQWIDVLNPSTEEVISRQPDGTIEDVNEALDAARAAQKAWGATPAIERAAWLKKLADGVRKHRDEFVDIIMREQGKTLTWASVEVDVTADYFDYMASFAALGYRVTALERVRIGALALDGQLAPGKVRELSAEEAARVFDDPYADDESL